VAAYVETDNVKILIDPGVSLTSARYSLELHSIELRRLDEHWKEIVRLAKIRSIDNNSLPLGSSFP